MMANFFRWKTGRRLCSNIPFYLCRICFFLRNCQDRTGVIKGTEAVVQSYH